MRQAGDPGISELRVGTQTLFIVMGDRRSGE
jgi:hypothetical protein